MKCRCTHPLLLFSRREKVLILRIPMLSYVQIVRVGVVMVCVCRSQVSILSQATNVEILSLSVNKISSLSAFRHCHKLRELYLRKNRIASLKELVHLIKSPDGGKSGTVSDTLQVLWLCDNPCAMEEDYRGKVIALLPALTKVRAVSYAQCTIQSKTTIRCVCIDRQGRNTYVYPSTSAED